MENLETFRKETRAWLEANCPPEMRRPTQTEDDTCWGGRRWTFKSEAQRQWLERMAAKGWTVPEWPREYGGGGLSRDEAKILRQEMRALGCRSPLDSFGIWMLGPALLKYGTEEQKREHLPKIARGEIRWCQGYSEPGSGSDLASLQTRAEDKGDQFLVNGSKIWTSYADKADWIFCLVRTDPNAPKARRHQLRAVRYGKRGRLDQADHADLRRVAVLPDFLRRRDRAEGQPRRQAQQGMGHREVSAHSRARHDRRHGQHLGESLARADRGRHSWASKTACSRTPFCADRSRRSRSTRSPSA